jgi:RNA polymerase sigma factor (sigma-70 family)
VSRSDRDLIRACREGDRRAWRSLLDKYERLVFSIPLNYGLSREDAADIAQLTFTILIQNLDTLREDSRLGSWLATVARRHTWRLLERTRRESPGRERDLAESATLLGKGEESIERWELLEWLNEGLSLISEPCRRLLQALYFDPQQPSYAEVAERLNMPVGSIGPTRARCLQNLKRALSEG